MAKTRGQASGSPIKEEECEYKPELDNSLHGTNNKKKEKNKVTKKRTTKSKLIQVKIENAKPENTNVNKPVPLMALANSKRPVVTSEKLVNLIGYIVNDKMSLGAAAKKAKVSNPAAQYYYQEYQNDPEHKIPLPRTVANTGELKITQEKINNLIHYIVHDKMHINQAAAKAYVAKTTALRYYKKYLKDPERKIPTKYNPASHFQTRYTQKQVNELIRYIVDNKMSIEEASKKADMNLYSARGYYSKYLEDPNHDIPTPKPYCHLRGGSCTNDQVKALITGIVDEGMTLNEASAKVNMSSDTGSKYYKKYLEDPEHKIPTPESKRFSGYHRRYTIDQVEDFFRYMIVDKLTIQQASRKADINESSGNSYYKKYLKDSTSIEESFDDSYSIEKMKKLVKHIQNDKVTITSAAKEVNMNPRIAQKYYRMYMNDPQRQLYNKKAKQYTQEDVKKLIHLIEHDKMSICGAAQKINMGKGTAYRCYSDFKKDPEHKIPVQILRGHRVKQRVSDKYSKIVAEIYKNNPSVKPIHEQTHSGSEHLDISIKLESSEEDIKVASKDKK